MGDNPDKPNEAESLIEGEAEFLGEGNLETVLAYCNSEGVQVGPFAKRKLPYTKQGGVCYAHLELRDRRTGYYRSSITEDGIQLTEAFGGPTETLCDKFEDIEIDGQKVPHLRVPAEGGKTALKNPEGSMYTGQAHDTIKRDYDSTPLGGTVYHVTNDGKEGYFHNGELCGRHNGMNTKSTIVRAGDEKVGYKIFLIAENEAIIEDKADNGEGAKDAAESKEGAGERRRISKKVIDVNTGEIKYRDEDKCTDVNLVMIGRELCAVKTFGTEEQGNLEQAIRAENGDRIYHGVLKATVGTWFYGYGKKPIVRMYTPEGWLVPINRRDRPCFTKEPVPMEAEDGPNGDGLYEIDGVLYMKLHLLKENPRDEEDKFVIVYRTEDMNDGFGGPHDEEALSVEGRPNTITVSGVTGKLFRNRAAKTMYWMGSNGMRMFSGEHWDDLKTIEWMYGAEGRRAEGARILKHFEDVARGHTVLDFQARPYFMNKDSANPEHHANIRDFWVLSYKKDGEGRNVLIAEAEDPVSRGRRVKHFFSNLFHPSRWREVPSTYYLMDGTRAGSIDALMEHLGVPDDAQLVNVDDFKDATVRTSRPRDTQRMKAVSLDAPSVDPQIKEMLQKASEGKLDSAEAKRILRSAETAEGAGEGLEATLQNAVEAQESQPAAYEGVDAAPAPAEEAPVQLPDGNGGEQPQEGEQAASNGKPKEGKITSLGAELFPEEVQDAGNGGAEEASAEAPPEVVKEEMPDSQPPAPAEEVVAEEQPPEQLPDEGAADVVEEAPEPAVEAAGTGAAEEAPAEQPPEEGNKPKGGGSWLLDGDGEPK